MPLLTFETLTILDAARDEDAGDEEMDMDAEEMMEAPRRNIRRNIEYDDVILVKKRLWKKKGSYRYSSK